MTIRQIIEETLSNNLYTEEQKMIEDCNQKILQNLDRQLNRSHKNHNQVVRLLSMRWFVSNEINPLTS